MYSTHFIYYTPNIKLFRQKFLTKTSVTKKRVKLPYCYYFVYFYFLILVFLVTKLSKFTLSDVGTYLVRGELLREVR